MALEELGMTTAQMFGIEYVISMFILMLIFSSLILLFLTKKFKFKKTNYTYAFIVTFVTAFVSLLFEFTVPIGFELMVFPIYFVIDVVLIYLIYPETMEKSLKVGFIWWVISIILSLVLGLVIGFVLSAIGITTGTVPVLIAWLTG